MALGIGRRALGGLGGSCPATGLRPRRRVAVADPNCCAQPVGGGWPTVPGEELPRLCTSFLEGKRFRRLRILIARRRQVERCPGSSYSSAASVHPTQRPRESTVTLADRSGILPRHLPSSSARHATTWYDRICRGDPATPRRTSRCGCATAGEITPLIPLSGDLSGVGISAGDFISVGAATR